MEEPNQTENQENQPEYNATPETPENKFVRSATVVFINNGTGNYHNSINSVIGKYETNTNIHIEQLIAILKAEIQKGNEDKEIR